MIARIFAGIFAIATLNAAAAQERVTVATVRSIDNGALFLTVGQGAFKAEGLDVDLKFYASPQHAVTALANGDVDLASAEFTAAAFNLAGKGTIKIVAGQARERQYIEGNNIVASTAAAAKGLKKPDDLADRSIALVGLGSPAHYQLALIADAKKIDFKSLLVRPQPTADAAANAVASGQVDAAILPAFAAHTLLAAGQVSLVGWVSDIDEAQIGALFASSKAIAQRRATLEKFVRVYRRGAIDFTAAMARRDKYAKRTSDAKSQAAAAIIAKFVYPTSGLDRVIPVIETSAFYSDPRIDGADIARQFAWQKAQGLVDAAADPRLAIDASFAQ